MNRLRVNDIFYSLQGEGHHTGRAAVFVRLSGCNLACPFCDTDFSSFQMMTEEDVLQAIHRLLPANTSLLAPRSPLPAPRLHPSSFMIILTGGEPTLQNTEPLIDLLHQQGFFVSMETNGTHQLPSNLDWSTVSPKTSVAIDRCNELKLVFTENCRPEQYLHVKADYYYLQPCDTGDPERNRAIIDQCIGYIQTHPLWRLSLQVHKLAGFK